MSSQNFPGSLMLHAQGTLKHKDNPDLEKADSKPLNDKNSSGKLTSRSSHPINEQHLNEKAAACRFAIERFYECFFEYLGQRDSRRALLEERMKAIGIDASEQHDIFQELAQKETEFIRFRRLRLTQNQFEIIKLLGRGSYGQVFLVRMKGTSELFAMKRLEKSDVIKKEQVTHARSEREIMARNDISIFQSNPWIVNLLFAFQDPTHLFLIMEYVPGGELLRLMINWNTFTEEQTRFYVSELVLAIESIHELGYIHRDIKPDNLLLDHEGHIKVSDFGLCTGLETIKFSQLYEKLTCQYKKASEDKNEEFNEFSSIEEKRAFWKANRRIFAFSAVGTPDYIAPEVFTMSEYDSDCDWWSVGCIMYEMLIGYAPFFSDSPAETFRKVVNWRTSLQFPSDIQISPDACDLIKNLICDVDSRLSTGGIKKHPFFKGVDWSKVREMDPPFIPRIDHPEDTRNFDDLELPEQNITIPKESLRRPFDPNNIYFIGYTFKSFEGMRPIKEAEPFLSSWSKF